jgi:galactokinase
MHSEFNIRKFIGIAPGRLDVMGGIADYSGSLLLQMPIAEETVVTLVKRDDGVFMAHTDAEVALKEFNVDLIDLDADDLRSYGEQIKRRSGGDWAVYVLGCFRVLEDEKDLLWEGAEIHISSGVPAGKGVSSSAAIEVATMHAICKAYDLRLDPVELSLLAQKVENHVVGAACGLMDQLSVNLGLKNHLLPIICQPHEVFQPIPIPNNIRFVGLDSGVRHAVSAASYSDVRTAAFMGYTVAMMKSNKQISARPFGGYLANISLSEFNEQYAPLIPSSMTGREFLENFGVHIDPVTTVDPDTTYNLLACATHPVQENHRIQIFRDLLMSNPILGDLQLESAGKLMLESHEGYNSVGLGEPVTNRIVDMVMNWGIGRGIAGARISGGGGGGTVTMMITSDEGFGTMMKIKTTLEKETGKELKLFESSSDGAHYRN